MTIEHENSALQQTPDVGLPALRPDRDVAKFLISSTCPLEGRYDTSNLLIAEAVPGLGDRTAHLRQRHATGAHYAFTMAFRTPAADQGGFIIPQYDHVAEMMCGYLSVLYGKRFDYLGAIESSGLFSLPNLRAMDSLSDPAFATNSSRPRADFGFPLDLAEVGRLTDLMFGEAGTNLNATAFRGASKFYMRALQTAEIDIEIAYLHLITAGEILAGAVEIPEDLLMAPQTRVHLGKIKAEMQQGEEIVGALKRQARSVKRRFVEAFLALTDEAFFERSEASQRYAALNKATYRKVLGAAYDLRSRYVHSGESFGGWIYPRGSGIEEIQSGRPVVKDKDFAKTLATAPTYSGLERVVRYGLLRFSERLGVETMIASSDAINDQVSG